MNGGTSSAGAAGTTGAAGVAGTTGATGASGVNGGTSSAGAAGTAGVAAGIAGTAAGVASCAGSSWESASGLSQSAARVGIPRPMSIASSGEPGKFLALRHLFWMKFLLLPVVSLVPSMYRLSQHSLVGRSHRNSLNSSSDAAGIAYGCLVTGSNGGRKPSRSITLRGASPAFLGLVCIILMRKASFRS